ncbi:MAG: hypothetical protein LBV47_07205 [Bacteroidales bacterium]|nr:hypothetical protein [Bacteroidales bacterium]
MKADGWSITHNNKRFMRALYRSNPLTSTIDMVTLRFAGRTVLYNVINDPDAFRSGFACLLSQCRHGRRLIKRIADFVVRVNAAQMDDVNFVSELK